MKKIIAILVLAFAFSSVSACEWVNGYFRKDGTYVQGHWRGCGY